MPYTIELMADDTAGLLEAIGIRQANVLWISTGSRIAVALAARYPDLVQSLVLNVAAVRSPDREDQEAAASFERLRAAMIQPGFMEKMLAYPPTITSFFHQFEALKEFDGRPLLESVRARVLIVNGTRDPSTPVRYGEELRDGIPGARLIFVEKDHMFQRTEPDLLVWPMLEFLAGSGAD